MRGTLEQSSRPPYAVACPVLREVPIVFVTAYGARYTREEALAAGGDELVQKPVNFAQLNVVLTKLSLRKLLDA